MAATSPSQCSAKDKTTSFLLKEICHSMEFRSLGCFVTSALWWAQEKLWFCRSSGFFSFSYFNLLTLFVLKTLFIYFYLERGEGKEKERKETSMCGCLSCTPYRGPGWQPRHVPWLGIELVTLWFASRHSTLWATPSRANLLILERETLICCCTYLCIHYSRTCPDQGLNLQHWCINKYMTLEPTELPSQGLGFFLLLSLVASMS